MPKFILYISKEDFSALKNKEIECFVVDASLSADFLSEFNRQAQAQSKIVLAYGENAAAICQQYEMDGLVQDLSSSPNPQKDSQNLRQKAGSKILGLISRNRRHEAMIISEAEPDFLIFKVWSAGEPGSKDLVKWYNELFLIQSAIWVEDENADFMGYETDNVILNNAHNFDFDKLFSKK